MNSQASEPSSASPQPDECRMPEPFSDDDCLESPSGQFTRPPPICPIFSDQPADVSKYPGSNSSERHEAMLHDIGGQISRAIQHEVLLSWLLGLAERPDKALADLVQELLHQQGQSALAYAQSRCQSVLDKLTALGTSLRAFSDPADEERLKSHNQALSSWQDEIQTARRVIVTCTHYLGSFEGPCPLLDGLGKGDVRPQTQMEQHCRLYFLGQGWRLFNGNVYMRRTVQLGQQEHRTPHWMRVPRKAQPGEDPYLDGVAALDQAYNKLQVGPAAQDWCSKQATKVDVLHMLEHNYDLKLPPIERHFITFRDGMPLAFCLQKVSMQQNDQRRGRHKTLMPFYWL